MVTSEAEYRQLDAEYRDFQQQAAAYFASLRQAEETEEAPHVKIAINTRQ